MWGNSSSKNYNFGIYFPLTRGAEEPLKKRIDGKGRRKTISG